MILPRRTIISTCPVMRLTKHLKEIVIDFDLYANAQ